MEDTKYAELRDEVQRLRDEQQRLRDEQEKLRRERSNGHDGQNSPRQQESGDQQKAKEKNGDQNEQKGDEKKDQPKNEDERREWPKPPLKVRVRTYVNNHRKGVLFGVVGFLAATFLIILLVLYLRSYESTDDAQVDGHLNSISPRISGTVTAVYVENNQNVTAGQLLAELDARDYATALAQAEAQLRAENPNVPIIETTNETTIFTSGADVIAAQAAMAAAQKDYEARLASVRQAEANNAKAQTDVARYQALVQREEISHEQYDTIVANAKTQAATREAAVLAARAQQEQAALNLSYTKIYAPVSGVVNEKTVEIGQHIQAGEQLLVISQLEDIWVTANFKETQLKRMRPGQPVNVKVDAFGIAYHGYVESMPGATGAVMSLLPPENATGNFVKVVQRMPVRIRLDKGEDREHRLRPGMSVVPKVWLK